YSWDKENDEQHDVISITLVSAMYT
ncbi:hypothetical protein L150_05159, partial [Candida albicans Ca529L]